MKYSLLLAGLLFAANANSAPKSSSAHAATGAEQAQASLQNALASQNDFTATAPAAFQPAADTANFGYVLMSGDTEDEQEVINLRETIAKNLPAGVKLVILTDASRASAIKQQYSQWISADRLIIATSDDANVDNGFWARDSFPVPVVSAGNQTSLVAAHYFRDFDSAAAIDKAVGSPAMTQPNITFVGGDLIADSNGVCFSVAGDREFGLTPQQIQSTYGCKTLHVMDHVAGLGDVDEVLKPLSPTVMLTNRTEYAADLKSWGYQVVMLPALDGYRTYANSLIVGKTVFMPSYNVSTDAQAAQVYQQLGYSVVQIQSIYLSDEMWGSIHCQTMAYPNMPQAQFMRALNIRAL